MATQRAVKGLWKGSMEGIGERMGEGIDGGLGEEISEGLGGGIARGVGEGFGRSESAEAITCLCDCKVEKAKRYAVTFAKVGPISDVWGRKVWD